MAAVPDMVQDVNEGQEKAFGHAERDKLGLYDEDPTGMTSDLL